MFAFVTKAVVASLLVLACDEGIVAQSNTRAPLTDFQPSKDFFQVPNDRDGYCFGIVEMAIANWMPKRPDDERLASLGNKILSLGKNAVANDPTSHTAGEQFLKDINSFAQNHSNRNAVTDTQRGTYLAEVLLRELKTTKRPQVLELDQGQNPGHAVVVYDAEKRDGKFVFRVGDPNYPPNNDLTLVYENNRWTTGANYPKDSMLTKPFTPELPHWDDHAKAITGIPKFEMHWRLQMRVNEVARDNKPVYADMAQIIGRDLHLNEYFERPRRRAGRALDQFPVAQADIDRLNTAVAEYAKEVAEHNRRVQEFANVNEVFATDGRVHFAYGEKLNAAAKAYNSTQRRAQTEFNRLGSIRDAIANKADEFERRYEQLAADHERLRARRSNLDSQRADLMRRAADFQTSVTLPQADTPGNLAVLPTVTLAVLERPSAQHPIVGRWTISGGRPGTFYDFDSNGSFTADNYGTGGIISGTWSATGPNSVRAKSSSSDRFVTHNSIYEFTVTNGLANGTFSVTSPQGNVLRGSGSFTLKRE